MESSASDSDVLQLKSLSRKQRRVLGTLVEKGITTPDQYPLTLKGVVTGCNQKNNRDPVTNYSEDDVYQTLDELRQMGLVAFVQTETGRTERYRHYCRQKLALAEGQLAVFTELLLRGRQQLGELRTRASRMCAIDSQEDLRQHLVGLLDRKMVRANGPLERRGAEVDHNMFAPGENHEALTPLSLDDGPTQEPVAVSASSSGNTGASTPAFKVALEEFTEETQALRSRIASLEETVSALKDELSDLKRQLGV